MPLDKAGATACYSTCTGSASTHDEVAERSVQLFEFCEPQYRPHYRSRSHTFTKPFHPAIDFAQQFDFRYRLDKHEYRIRRSCLGIPDIPGKLGG